LLFCVLNDPFQDLAQRDRDDFRVTGSNSYKAEVIAL